MRKYPWFPVLKQIARHAVVAAVLAVTAVCAGFSSAEAAAPAITTNHWKNGSTEGYSIHVSLADSAGAYDTVTITAGPGITAPVALDQDSSLTFSATVDLSTAPHVNDSYTLVLSFLDTSIADQTVSATVTGVVNAFATPAAPLGVVANTASPNFTWTAPSSPPAGGYALSVSDANGYQYWRSVLPIANTVLSKGYNFDNTAQSTLSPGVWYNWSVFALDASGNSAETRGASYLYGANFSGKVTDLNGAGVPGVSVMVYNSLNVVQGSTSTAADGSYVYGGLTAGGNYKVAFSNGSNLVYYNNMLDSSAATLLPLTIGTVTGGVNAVLGNWGIITGTVVSSLGGNVAGAQVSLYDNATGQPVSGVTPAITKADGTFTLSVVPAGTYKVYISGVSGYENSWYPYTVSVSGGNSTPLPTNAVLNKINLTGKVTDVSGAPVTGIWVYLLRSKNSFDPVPGFSGVQSGSDGTYTISGIAAGTYYVWFNDATKDITKKLADQFYNKRATVALADPVTVTTTGVTQNINAVMGSGRPTVTITAPPVSRSLTVNIGVTASEPVYGVAGYMVTESPLAPAASDTKWTAAPPATYPFTSTGTKTLYAWAKGNNGLVSLAGPSAQVVVDTTPPVITLSALSTGAVTSNATMNLAGQVSIPNGTISSLFVNGAAVQFGNDGLFSYAVHLVAGSNTVSVVASDSTGLQTTATRTVTYNAAAPALAVTAPADITATTNPTMSVAGTVASGSTVTVSVNGTPQSATVSGTSFSTVVDLAAGVNTLEIVATDGSGNKNTAKRSILLVNDGPDVAITSPIEDLTTNLASYTISGRVSTTKPTTVTISAGTNTYTPTVDPGTGSYSQVVPLVAGMNNISVDAQDSSGISNGVQRIIIVSGKSGDCNLDGIVDLVEVQSAIKMFLGAKAVASCDDLNGDSAVDLVEVQKIIKAFLAP